MVIWYMKHTNTQKANQKDLEQDDEIIQVRNALTKYNWTMPYNWSNWYQVIHTKDFFST